MKGYEREFREKRPWRLLDRLGVTMVVAMFVFLVGLYFMFRRAGLLLRPAAFSFETLLWVTAAAAIVTFLLTFTARFDEWLTGRK